MGKRYQTAWIVISFIGLIFGWLWLQVDKEGNVVAFNSYFFGLISSLLAVGYYSTPSNSIYGKIAFLFVIIMVTGIVFKILYFTGGDAIIVTGLVGIFGSYLVMWLSKKQEEEKTEE